ncbi:MAG: TAXI family TRAP transporter solute-binding subunit [Dysosmobacter sp.]|nr:TAXI family TRAP transporter solute-binding subunit [Dysosmobacter sp.]
MKKMLSLVMALCMVFVLTACGGSGSSGSSVSSGSAAASSAGNSGGGGGGATILTMSTGDTGGSLYPAGSAIAKIVNDNVSGVKMNIETSSGSADNARNTSDGTCDLGLCTADVATQAYTSTGKFEGQNCNNIKALFPIYSSIWQAMALKSTNIEYFEDTVGEAVSVGMAASAAELVANLVYTEMGENYPDCINAQYLGVAEGCDAVKDGTAVAHVSFGGYPQGGMLDLSNTKEAMLLKFKDETLEKILADYSYYFETVVPAGTYTGQEEDVTTFGVKCLCIANGEMSDEMAYNITKAVMENVEDLVAGNSAMKEMLSTDYVVGDLPIDFHPGAIKYYTEVGLM